MIRLLVADDHGIIREGLARLFATVPDVEVVGLAADGREAIALADETSPDVVLMDVVMPHVDGLEAARRIAAAHPASRIIMLTGYDDQAIVREALRAGATGYVLKHSGADQVVRAVRVPHAAVTVPGLAGGAPSDMASS